MSDQLVSIIIPVYKVEEYLNSCMESVCSQTYSNIEIILIDDGSPDDCPAMCEEWARRDSRIKVIHQKNKGLSGARNTGLAQSSGEYVLYVDSDDVIALDMVDHMVMLANKNNTDIVVSTFRFSEKDNSKSARLSGNIFYGKSEEMIKKIAEFGLWQAWGKLIKREIAIQCMFKEKLIYEDYENTPRLFVQANNVVISMDGRYYYTVRSNSIMGERQKATSIDFSKITEEILKVYEKSNFADESKKYMYSFLFKQLIYNYNTTIKYGEDKGKEFLVYTRRIMKKQNSKWISNKEISVGRKSAYFLLAYIPAVYAMIYKNTHR